MKKYKNIILIVVIIIIAVIIAIFIGKYLFDKTKQKQIEEIKVSAKEYFSDTSASTTSVWSLLENGYLKDTKQDKCTILELKEKDVIFGEIDCQKSEEYAKNPVIIFNTTNDFKINEWNNVGTKLSFSFKNGGNSYYSEEDITFISWVNRLGVISNEKELDIKRENQEDDYTLQLEFKNGEYILEKEFDIKVNVDKPVLVDYFNNNGDVYLNYEDSSGIKDIYYYYSREDVIPSKDKMSTNKDDFELTCEYNYYIYAYAKDNAGLESDVEMIERFHYNCQNPSVITGGGSSKNNEQQ